MYVKRVSVFDNLKRAVILSHKSNLKPKRDKKIKKITQIAISSPK